MTSLFLVSNVLTSDTKRMYTNAIGFLLFQSKSHTWADVGYQAVLTLGPALITGGVSWLAFRSQLKLKDKEIEGGAKLKARELMFKSYQGVLERREKDGAEIGKVLGQLGVAFQIADDEEAQLKARVALMETLGAIITPLRGLENDLESQLEATGLGEKYKAQMQYIKKTANINLMGIPYDQIPAQYDKAMTMLSYVSLIKQAILEKKREELFKD